MYYINLIYMYENCKTFAQSVAGTAETEGVAWPGARLNIAEVPESAQGSAERVSMAGTNNASLID